MRVDWEARAGQSPSWFVDSRSGFGEFDSAAFHRRGEIDLAHALDMAGLELRGTERVLELGCGMGRMTGAIAERVAHVVGVDISGHMLALAKGAVGDRPNVSLVRTDGVSLAPLAEKSFDLVICIGVFQHLPTIGVIETITREIARVLLPGGRALLELKKWSYSPYPWLRAAAAWTLNYRGFRTLGVYSRTFLGVRLNAADIRGLCARCGLTLEVHRQLPPRQAWVLARR
jgi:ubiquinone/menaquinone biosynthesis C-methylase UbiE